MRSDDAYPVQAFERGEMVVYRGQAFWPIARRAKEVKGGGRMIEVDFWRAGCADCGASFEFDLMRPYDARAPFRPVRRCETHRRRGGKPIGWDAVHKLARPPKASRDVEQDAGARER